MFQIYDTFIRTVGLDYIFGPVITTLTSGIWNPLDLLRMEPPKHFSYVHDGIIDYKKANSTMLDFSFP